MKIDSIKDLERLLKLAQKLGAYQMEVDGIKFVLTPQVKNKKLAHSNFSQLAPEASVQVPQFNGDFDKSDTIETDELSEEQLLMWSTGEAAPQ